MAYVKGMDVKTRWVKSHSGDEYNERCDYLAGKARKELEKSNEKSC
jgi:ribonuclease HI